MSNTRHDAIYICTTDDSCPRHGKYIYYCYPCHKEWRKENPHTTKAIGKFAAGKINRQAVDAAKKKDKKLKLSKESGTSTMDSS